MIVLDGSAGEGGGQILRSALTLSILTRTPFRMERIRAGRQKPGLLAQHLTAIAAAKAVSNAEVTGADPGSREITFKPRTVHGGDHAFRVGTAGSSTLVLQTVLPALLRASEPSTITVEGGTHNPAAPPFEFLAWSFLPVLTKMGAQIELTLERPGFYPKGGGRVRMKVTPGSLEPLELEERGAVTGRRVIAISAGLPPAIADRELRVAKDRLSLGRDEVERIDHPEELGPGNVVYVVHRFANVAAVFSGFGDRGARAEEVAEQAIGPSLRYLESKGAVDEHLADQLLVPMAMGRGGVFTTSEPSSHFETQLETLRTFLGGDVEVDTADEKTWTITMRGALL
ncbi:MAG: RNA 3'-terminal phosphate cyclase [Deltaproteobacteria bacterium]|nr:RNA 3'-terminal phosphate cyclase [Deltaproteobacteria bacterium]